MEKDKQTAIQFLQLLESHYPQSLYPTRGSADGDRFRWGMSRETVPGLVVELSWTAVCSFSLLYSCTWH